MSDTCETCTFYSGSEYSSGYGDCIFYPHFKRRRRNTTPACGDHQPNIETYLENAEEDTAGSSSITGTGAPPRSFRSSSGSDPDCGELTLGGTNLRRTNDDTG